MKKLLTILLAVCMAVTLAACSSAPKTATYTLGLGVTLNTDSSKTGNAQLDATYVALVLDADKKIAAARIDVAQNKVSVADGVVDMTAEFPTKREKQDAYGMKGVSPIGKEWFEQAEGLEAWLVGKTVDEVVAMGNAVVDNPNFEGHKTTADETLAQSCTMQVGDFVEAIVKAANDDAAVTFEATPDFKVGVTSISELDGATVNAGDEDGVVACYESYAAVVVGADGKILAALSDATQPKISFNKAGEITGTAFKGTKRELKFDYNMVAYSEATLEWFEQSKNFTNYVVGMTAADVQAIPTRERTADEPHTGYVVAADEALFAQCSMSLPGLQAVVAKACNVAR